MGIYKSYKRGSQLKRCNQTRLEKQKKELRSNIIKEITKYLVKFNFKQFLIQLQI